jgi:hypothetical protein
LRQLSLGEMLQDGLRHCRLWQRDDFGSSIVQFFPAIKSRNLYVKTGGSISFVLLKKSGPQLCRPSF